MYGKFLNAFGIAFTLFIVIMFLGYMFRSGFSDILKFFLSRMLIIIFIVTLFIGIGIIIYSIVNGINPLDTLNTFLEFLKEQWSQI